MSEKRRYFRIQDSIGLALRSARVGSPDLKLSDTETVTDQELKNIEKELNSMVNAMWGENPKIAKSIGLVNRKIELLGRGRDADLSLASANFDIRFENVPVSLSASGIGFRSEQSLQVGDRLELLLILPPANARVVVRGIVVECVSMRDDGGNTYQVRVDFDLTAAEEEHLVQHIVQRQVQLLAKEGAN